MKAFSQSRRPRQPRRSRRSCHSGAFSLVEIVISMAIIATGMIAIIGLIPVGLQASRDATVRTITAIILENLHDRLEGEFLFQGADEPREGATAAKSYFYDNQGLYLAIPGQEEMDDINDAANGGDEDDIAAKDALDALLFKRRYLVKVKIKKIHDENKAQLMTNLRDGDIGNAFALGSTSSELLAKDRVRAIIVDIYSPVNPATGEPMGRQKTDADPDADSDEITVIPLTSVSYYLTTLTGIEWEDIDSTYEPKIEF